MPKHKVTFIRSFETYAELANALGETPERTGPALIQDLKNEIEQLGVENFDTERAISNYQFLGFKNNDEYKITAEFEEDSAENVEALIEVMATPQEEGDATLTGKAFVNSLVGA